MLPDVLSQQEPRSLRRRSSRRRRRPWRPGRHHRILTIDASAGGSWLRSCGMLYELQVPRLLGLQQYGKR